MPRASIDPSDLQGGLASVFGPGPRKQRPCLHTPDLGGEGGKAFLASLLPALRLACLQDQLPFLRIPQSIPMVRCGQCYSTRRLFVCLTCLSVLCGQHGHFEKHATNKSHHFALEIRQKALWCGRCKDVIYSPQVDRLAEAISQEATRLVHLPTGTSPSGPVSSVWRPTVVEKTSVARHSRPLRCSRIRGVRNLGSTCFLSTVIQTFLHNPMLRAHFLSGSHIPRGERECPVVKDRGVCFGCEVDTLFGQVWGPGSPEKRTDRPGGYVVPNRPSLPLPLSLSPSPYDPLPSENGGGDGGEAVDGGVVPTGIIWTLWGAGLRDGLASTASSTVLAGYAQQDAHEFFIAALDMLHASSPGMREDGRCRCIVHRTFAGSLSSQVRCEGCGNVTRTLDPILDLSLEVPLLDKARSSSLSLPECIEKYTLPERLRGTNYTCGSCGDSTQEVSKRMSIATLPPILHIQLKRFKHGANGGEKVETPVSLPFFLDMSPYTTAGLDAKREGITIHPKVSESYRLFAVICHRGRMETGHYTVYTRIGDGWYHFDDHMVRPASEEEVSKANGYMCCYIQDRIGVE